MKKICFLLFALLSLYTDVKAQLNVTEECRVKNGDLTARRMNDTNPIIENGDTVPFAIVRVGLVEHGVTFESRWVLKTEYKEGEYWVYFMGGVKNVTIKSKRFTPLHYTFPSPLEDRTTYVMTIQKPVADESQFGELEIRSNVSKADLYIDGVKISDGVPFTYKGEGGTHTLEVKAIGYTSQQREVEIPIGHKNMVTVNLFAEGSLEVDGVSYGLVPVAATTFSMGSKSFYYENPIRQVSLRPFSVGSTMVSTELWNKVMDSLDERMKGENGQVVNVTYDECQDFITALNQRTGKTFRLPTEAEWEYCVQNKDALGISDMQKCLEWCYDWFGKYLIVDTVNPQGPETGVVKVVRGGSLYGDDIWYKRPSYRWHQKSDSSSPMISFRLVCDE